VTNEQTGANVPMKTEVYRKRSGTESKDGLGMFKGMRTFSRGRKMTELLRHIMDEKDYGEFKELISDRGGWRHDDKCECMSETC